MRDAFVKRLSELAALEPRIILITGDLGFGVLTEFERRFPSQYLNVGVAEQNLTAVGTGMALEGFIVFTYSIGNFPTLRCLEQVRNDTCYHEASLTIVSVGGGYSYGQLGMSHHATEDLSIMRAIPGLTLCAPASDSETRQAVDALVDLRGPAYLRLERGSAEFRDDGGSPFVLGRARVLRNGDDLTLISTGGIAAEALAAGELLATSGIECRILSMHTLKPLDANAIRAAAIETGGIVTIEENTILGGLGGAVAEVCLESGRRPRRFLRLGIPDQYTSIVGDQAYLRSQVGLDRSNIAARVRRLLDEKP